MDAEQGVEMNEKRTMQWMAPFVSTLIIVA
jgi:hypothetical protein